ncbi:hypothetical protein MRX96_019840 [Rhipicephalus microplus]
MRGRHLGLKILSFPLRQLAEVTVRRCCLRTSVNERYVTRPTTDVGVCSIVVSARWLGFLQPQPSRQQAPGESCGWCWAGQTLRREPSRNAALATGQPQLYRAHRSSFFQRLGEEPTLAAVGPASSLRGSMADATDLSLFGRSFFSSPLTTTVTWNSFAFLFQLASRRRRFLSGLRKLVSRRSFVCARRARLARGGMRASASSPSSPFDCALVCGLSPVAARDNVFVAQRSSSLRSRFVTPLCPALSLRSFLPTAFQEILRALPGAAERRNSGTLLHDILLCLTAE